MRAQRSVGACIAEFRLKAESIQPHFRFTINSNVGQKRKAPPTRNGHEQIHFSISLDSPTSHT